MSMRGLHSAMGALVRLQREALSGQCRIGACGDSAVGFIERMGDGPVAVCARHKVAAESRGHTVYSEPWS